jgi:hypothetical protein
LAGPSFSSNITIKTFPLWHKTYITVSTLPVPSYKG